MTQSFESNIITGISFAEYWETYAALHYEWDGDAMIALYPASGKGEAIMPAIYRRQDDLRRYIEDIFTIYFEAHPIGKVQADPFPMRFELDNKIKTRLPDLQVVLTDDLARLPADATYGAADIVVEIVSADSGERDYRIKFSEYQAIGVREYWIVDPDMGRAEFNVLDESGTYQRAKIDPSGIYRTALLPKLAIHVPTFWQDQLPGPREIIRQMDDPTP